MSKKTDLKRIEIIKAAQKRFIRHGLNKTTIEEIARDMRIGKSTLYTYFKSKEEIYYASVDAEIAAYFAGFEAIMTNDQINAEEEVKQILSLKAGLGQNCKLFYRCILLFLNGTSNPEEDAFIKKFLETETGLLAQIIEKLQPGKKKGPAFDSASFSMQTLSLPVLAGISAALIEKGLTLPGEMPALEKLHELWANCLLAPITSQA